MKWTVLEIKIPEEVEKTPKAMENVLHSIWAMYDPPSNIRDYWIKGNWMACYTFEIIGRKGEINFYIRVPNDNRNLLESAIYGEYPDAEIKEVPDYVYTFGKDVPNEDYDLWGADLALLKEDIYPIRTYDYWETEMTREVKKIDPLASLFETFGNLKEGEEVWVQINARPITNEEHPYIENCKKTVNQIMKRPEEKKPGLLDPLAISRIPSDMWNVVAEGKPIPSTIEEESKESLDMGLMRLSPGEAEVVRAIEEKLGKGVYESNIRFLYIAKRNIFSVPRGVAAVCGAFNQFSTINLNGFKPDKTKTKAFPWLFEKRRLYGKKRKIFRHFAKRKWAWHRKPYIFSTAELATMYHFPGKTVAPAAAAPRVRIKKGEIPSNLPT